ncbi:hypothetical protein C8J57DRAFT_1475265 [Mycena rebaudengoi]|nr:hypothetical protein C8J57DRAFT_1475265 [Mycena rebaudengoi]
MDPITITTTIITLASFIKDLIDVGQNIKRSIEKVGENRRRIREVVDDILGTLAQLANLSRGREDSFHVQELLDALGNLKEDMLHVLSVAQQISAPAPRSGLRGLSSQIKAWLERDDIEAQVKHLNKHVKKCYIQFTAFSAARIEHASARIENTSALIENTSVRVEQRLIVNSVEQQAKLQRLEGMMARVLVHTQFGQNMLNQTMDIVASDLRHRTLESQYLSVQVMRLLDSLDKYTASHYFHAETPCWDPAKPFLTVSERPTSKSYVLHSILGVVLQIDQSPAHLFPRDAANMLLKLGDMLSSLGMQSEAMASDTFSVKLFRYLASRENCVGALPRLAAALFTLSYRYRYDWRHDLAVHTSQQSVELGHFLFESTPNDANRVLFLRTSNVHSSNLRAAGQIDAAISVGRDALAICRSLLPKTLKFASTRPNWASQYPECEFQAAECAQSFFCLSGTLSVASRHREAYLASKEGLEIVARFAGAIPPPSGSDIDGFFNHMCNMAEAGEFDMNFLADVAILYSNLSRIYPPEFSKEFLLVLYARAYFSNHEAVAISNLRLFLEPSWDSPPPIMGDFSTSAPLIDDGVVESILHAGYALKFHLELDAIHDALPITEDAIQYNLSRTTPQTDEVDWLGLQALILTGRVDQALRLLENTISNIGKEASRIAVRRTHWFLYFLFSDLSSTQLDVGQTQSALETAEKAVAKCREFYFSHPHQVQPRLATAHALSALSNCLAAVGRTDEGLAAAREAVAIYAGLPRRGHCSWGYTRPELNAKAYHVLSLRLVVVEHFDEALANAEKAVEEYRESLSQAIRYTPSLANGLRNLASRFADIGRLDESITALKEAITLLRGVVDQLPHHLPALGDALEQLAGYLSMEGDSAGASAAASECAVIRIRVAHSPVSAEGEAEADSDSEFWDAEEGSGSSCEEMVSQGAAQTEGDHKFPQSGISPFQADDFPLSPPEAQVADASFSVPEPGTSQTTQQGVDGAQPPEALVPKTARDIVMDIGSKRLEVMVKIELGGGSIHIAWWILLGMMGLFCAWSAGK